MNNDSVSSADPLGAVVEAFLEQHRNGERPTVTEHIKRHPELAERLKQILPALLMLEKVGTLDGGDSPLATVTTDAPRQLGDYRILREVGRGGMGIVYEALQQSLGRHVALKVLPPNVARKKVFLERFHREARAVARLHHTNIAPVYGVGEDNGTYYYAMQYIQGHGLDVVIEDVRRLRGLATDFQVKREGSSRYHSASIAHSLLSGDVGIDAEALMAAPATAAQTTSDHTTHTDLSDQPVARYYRRIALLGAQVADALAHAHGLGVLHRDIKPSNLMLDAAGTVWVTDFGLAKASETEDLTQTGDIIGTIRYMAPERFQGQSDVRSDIYSLGVTLYELLALEPPFAARDRAVVMGMITNERPQPLSHLAPMLPRDLETIVHKAMAREPASRYASAADLADDLRCFLENRPIKARRASTVERFRRWCRRNPAIAALTMSVFVLLAVLAVGSTISSLWLRRERNAAVVAQDDAIAARNQARDEEKAKTEKLFQSYVDRARASRFSRRPGQRFDSLDAIKEAVRIGRQLDLPEERFDELRNLAISSLALPDWRPVGPQRPLPPGAIDCDYDDEHHLSVVIDLRGNVSVRRVEDDATVADLKFVPGDARVKISPDGRFLIACTEPERYLRVWDLTHPDKRMVLDRVGVTGAAFHPDCRHLIVTTTEGTGKGLIEQFDLISPNPHSTVLGDLGEGLIHRPRFNPQGTMLAVIQRTHAIPKGDEVEPGQICILDARTGQLLRQIKETPPDDPPAWHPNGEFLAFPIMKSTKPVIQIWDVIRGERLSELEGCDSFSIRLVFTPDGSLLASSGWEQKVRFWSWRTGQQMVSALGRSNLRFGRDGRLLYVQGNNIQLVEFVPGREYQSLGPGPGGSYISRYGGAIDPGGRLLAVGLLDGTVPLWDLGRAEEAGRIQGASRGVVHVEFAGRDGLVMTGTKGMTYFPIQAAAGAGAPLKFGPPQYWCAGSNESASSADGQIVAISRFDEGGLVDFRDWRKPPVPLRPQNDVRTVGISPDGRFVSTASFFGDGIKVWEAATGRLVKELAVGTAARAVFSPDGKWLAAKGQDKGYILKVGSWEEQVPVQWNYDTRAAFSPDIRLLAAPMEDGSIGLIDPATGTEKARLEDPSQHTACWVGFTPDGTRLVVISKDNQAIHIWDLRLIREELDALGLDWHEPPCPLAPPPHAVERLKVEIIGNELIDDPRKMLEIELQSYAVRLLASLWDADAHFHSGRIALAMGNAKGGLSELDIALALQPDHFSGLALRADEHIKAGRWQQAADDYQHLLELYPEDYCHYGHALGVTYYRLGRYKEALQTLERAAKLAGSTPQVAVISFEAMCHYQLGNKRQAEQLLDLLRAMKDPPDLPAHILKEREEFRAAAELLIRPQR